jgi:hypothetical protein
MTEEQVQEALDIILADKVNYSKSLNWAINYVKAGKYMTGKELKVQCLYILSNLQNWRHPEAKNVRIILKTFSK